MAGEVSEHLSKTCQLVDIQCKTNVSVCSWTGKRRDIVHHRDQCPADTVECSSRKESVPPHSRHRMKLRKRKKDEDAASAVPAICEWQGFRRDREQHENECEFVEIECPHQCSGKRDTTTVHRLRRGDLTAHLLCCVRVPVPYCPTEGCE